MAFVGYFKTEVNSNKVNGWLWMETEINKPSDLVPTRTLMGVGK